MRRPISILVGLICLTSLPGVLGSQPAGDPKPFAEAAVRFEQNATDGDVEAVFEIMGGEEGIGSLKVVAPDGRTIVDFTAPESGPYGIRQFRFESPEPKDVAALKKAYPEGVYTISGTTSSGTALRSQATLVHALPPTVSSVRPGADAENVATQVTISWTPPAGLSAITIEVAQERLNHTVSARLPGTATKFVVPAGFLLPGKEYVLAVGAVAKDGNMSVVESSFTTAAGAKAKK